MPLLRVFEDHKYWPEYSTFLIRDVPQPGRVRPRVGEFLAEYAVNAQPCGSIARAGAGWLDGIGSSDDRHVVRIEVHDTSPDGEDLSDWNDVIETPFASSGVVSLSMVVCGSVGKPFEFGAPGLYRVRFARRPLAAANGEGSPCEYLLRFWATHALPDPPRWLRRTRPLIDERTDGQDAFDGAYRCAVSDVLMLALWAAESATPVTRRWLADRLSSTPAIVRRIIERPAAARVFSVVGDLDGLDAPLDFTIHPRKPTQTRGPGVRRTVPGRGSAVGRTPQSPASAARRSVSARPVTGRPGPARHNETGTQEGQTPPNGPDTHHGAGTEPE